MTATKRTRLSPHDRRMQLLDCTQVIIQDKGLSSFTMEALAREAGVSNPLVYKYFDTRLALLQELLTRENTRFYTEMRERIAKAKSYEDIVTIAVSVNFEQFAKGNILTTLTDQPDIAETLGDFHAKESSKYGRFLVKALASQYNMTRAQAAEITVLASGAAQAAARQYSQFGGDKDALIANTVRFIFGGITALNS